MKNMQKLFEDYLRSTPVRSPFSQANYYSGGYANSGGFQDYTDLYNTTYRTHHEGASGADYREPDNMDGGFESVMYSEPINVLVAFPEDGAEGFEDLNEDECFVKFGLKAARGFRKDYRFLDQSIPGAGKVAVDEETANRIIEEPFKTIREVRPTYTRNFGETPAERIDEATERQLNEVVREELDKMLSRNAKIELKERKRKELVKLIRKRQLDENLERAKDAALDVTAKTIRESNKISSTEKDLLKETIQRYA